MKQIALLIVILSLSAVFTSCSNDDANVTAQSLVGYWKCTHQKWEYGEVDEATYDDSGKYYICFEDDYTGYMGSGSDELLEVGGYREFTWSISKNNVLIVFGTGRTSEWQVNALSGDFYTSFTVLPKK